MKLTKRANIYFIIIMMLEVFAPLFTMPIYSMFNITNIGLMLVINHIVIFIIPAIIYLIITKSPVRETLKLNKIRFVDALLMVLIGILSYPVSIFFSLITSLIFPNNLAPVISNIMSMPFILVLLVVAVTPAITEEVTVRGIILNGYKNCSRYKGALITGFIFGMLHLDGQQFLYATVLGFVLAMVVSVTNSIFAGCITHFTMNATSLVIQKLLLGVIGDATINTTEQPNLLELGVVPLIFAFIFYGTVAIGVGSLIWMIIKYIENKNINLGIIKREEKSLWFKKGERVFDLSMMIMILVYLIIMILTYLM